MSVTYDASNPFFRQLPMVAIVRSTVVKNGERVTSPDTTAKRVFFRVPNNRTFPHKPGQDEIMHAGTAMDRMTGFTHLEEYNPHEIHADHDDQIPRP